MQTYKTSKARENVLRKIRMALQEEAVPMPFPEAEKVAVSSVFSALSEGTPEETFAAEFSHIGGHFVFCNNQDELLANLKLLAESRGWTEVLCAHKSLFSFLVNNKLSFVREFNPSHEQAQVCITDCEAAVARTGSFLFSSRQNHGRVAPVYFPIHIIVVQPHQVVPDIADGLKLLRQKYNDQLPSMISLNTGPSRTADIEKTLVTGVHGPKEVFCFFLNQ
ncbi:LutC/YkgG family protein [Taibaiella koreensis]|uniref:LutC/YkgG family protein n=1 Tax=Taibaiella koreensis TaxID=1268548 RepID=UPI000E5A0A75|nr:LUD domain-containing protein [Taibaiella koreensis]